jgi:hypothetical protein
MSREKSKSRMGSRTPGLKRKHDEADPPSYTEIRVAPAVRFAYLGEMPGGNGPVAAGS